jgi:putative restriction endonuclease
MSKAEQFLGKLPKLIVDRARGDLAPHKPLLLLVLLELAEQGGLQVPELNLTPELAFRFFTYWAIVAHRRTQPPDVRLPFHHLQSEGYWRALLQSGEPSSHYRLTRYAAFDPNFIECIQDSACREQARRILIATYFQPQEQIALYTLCGLPIPSEERIARDANYKAPDEGQRQGREARFRLSVVPAYHYTCALTGYRLTTITGSSIVDAAHIHEFSDSRNNDVRNGLALCKNAHWSFDTGLWTLPDEYQVIVARGVFSEESPDHKALADYNGQNIRLPDDRMVWPDPAYIAWHRKNKYQGS